MPVQHLGLCQPVVNSKKSLSKILATIHLCCALSIINVVRFGQLTLQQQHRPWATWGYFRVFSSFNLSRARLTLWKKMIVVLLLTDGFNRVFVGWLLCVGHCIRHCRWHKGAAHSPSVKAGSWCRSVWVYPGNESDDSRMLPQVLLSPRGGNVGGARGVSAGRSRAPALGWGLPSQRGPGSPLGSLNRNLAGRWGMPEEGRGSRRRDSMCKGLARNLKFFPWT